MAVFICAADESYDSGNFFYGGFAAPVTDWEGFARAWNERVLQGPPQIPYLHMTDITDWKWQEKYGLKPWEADRRIEAAVEVIRSTGSLVPVLWSVDRREYAAIVRQPFTPGPKKKPAQLEPDYLCFLFFAYTALDWLHQRYADEIERVDFWVEENDRITLNMAAFHKSLINVLPRLNSAHFAPLVGEFHEVGKDRIPAQAADVLGWHARNARRKVLDPAGWRRYWKMVEGGLPHRLRFGHLGRMNTLFPRRLLRILWSAQPGTCILTANCAEWRSNP